MNKLNDNLIKTNAKLTDATEKMRKAAIKRDTAVSEKKTAMSNLAAKASAHKKVAKELLDTKKELANAKKEAKNLTRQLQQAGFCLPRGDPVECNCEKERIKLTTFEEKTAISCQNKEKEDQCKTDAKRNNVTQFTQWAAEIILLLQRGGVVAAGRVQEIGVDAIIIVAAQAGVSAQQ
jgi:hypothetical protein